jgi:hypothetical protein
MLMTTGEQVPGGVVETQVMSIPSQAVSQQTFSAAQTPLAHWSVESQAAPGDFFGWHVVPSQ